MTTQTKLPTALYAAAGAADLAREQLEKLPSRASKLSEQVKDGKLKDRAFDMGGRAVGELAGLGGRAYAEFASLRRKASKSLSKEALTAEAERARGAARRSADKVVEAFDKLVERGVQVLDGDSVRKPVKAEVAVDESANTSEQAPKDPAEAAEFIAGASESGSDTKPVRKVAKKTVAAKSAAE